MKGQSLGISLSLDSVVIETGAFGSPMVDLA